MSEFREKQERYQKNWDALVQRYPALAQAIEKIDLTAYTVVKAKTGDPFLQIRLQNQKIVMADDPEDPRSAVLTHLPAAHQNRTFFLIMGMGLGYLLFAAAQRFPNAKFFIIESDAHVFKRALENFDFTEYFTSARFEFAVSCNLSFMPRFFINYLAKDDNHMYSPTVQLISHPAWIQLSRSYYENVARIFKEACDDFWTTQIGNTYTDALIGLRFVLQNRRQMQRVLALDAYTGAYPKHVGVVVSSGPSLDSCLFELKKIQHKAVIICADSALKKLLNAGIKPFGVACVERDQVNADLFLDYDIPHDVILFAPPLVQPSLFANYPGPVVTLYRHAYPFPWMPPLLSLRDIGLSCAHLCFQVLHVFGCRKIALLGQDLAYDRESGSSHYQGVSSVATDQFQPMERILVEDNQGGLIASNETWLWFRNIFSDLIATQHGAPVYHVLPKEAGLKIHGSTWVDPTQFFSEMDTENGSPILFNEQIGREFLQKKLLGHDVVFKQRIETSIAQLKPTLAMWSAMKEVRDFESYLVKRNTLFQSLDPSVFYLLDDLIKPHLRKFEANAFSLWTQEEFMSQKDIFAELATQITGELINTLEQA